MFFTKAEIEILEHRLAVPDALCDALTDYHPDDEPVQSKWHPEDVMFAIAKVEQRLKNDNWLGIADEPIEAAVLRDCIEGSTWAGVHEGAFNDREISQQKFSAILRQMESVGRKISELLNCKIHVPAC
jgi:hypothetical protein